MSAKKIVDVEDLVRRYLAGESLNTLSKSLGVKDVKSRLLAHGVTLRTQSEAEVKKWARVVHADSRITINRDCEHCGAPMTRVVYPSQNLPQDNRFCSKRCSRLGTPATEEAKQAMARAGVERWSRDGEKELASARFIEMHTRPDVKTRHSAGIIQSWTPERRDIARVSAQENTSARKAGLAKMHADPIRHADYLKRLSDSMSRPETKSKVLASHKAYWSSLTEERRNELTANRLKGLMPYLNGKKRTLIELLTEVTLQDLKIDFIAQHLVDRAVLDFYIPSLHLDIECDGDYWHSLPKAEAHDRKRDWWLRSLGYTVVRMTETNIKADCYGQVIRALTIGARAAMSEAV